MRRISGLILAGLGAFLVALAVILPEYIASQVVRFPLNEYETATLTATGAAYLSPVKLTEVTGASIEVTDSISGVPGAGDSSIAVWSVYSSVYDRTNHQQLEPSSYTFAFDRRTAELVNCCDESVNGNSSIIQSGIAGYVFPIGTQKRTYYVFDATLGQPAPFAYSGTDTVDGIQAYRFAENVSAAKLGLSTLPTAEPEFYSMHLTYWVDPVTGALLKISENEDLYLANAATGAAVTHVFDAALRTTPATVAHLVAQDTGTRHKITIVQTILPLAFGIAGGLAIIAGIVLSLLAREPRQDAGRALPVEDAPRDAAKVAPDR
jgi:hypothetical protein